MSLNLALVRAGFKIGLAYRFHFFVNMIRAPLTLVIYFFLWTSIFRYAGKDVINGFTFAELMTYYAISIIVGVLTYSGCDEWIEEEVLNGEVVSSLLRPVQYIRENYFLEIGIRTVAVVCEAIPTLLVALVFFNVTTASAVNGVFFIASVILASWMTYLLTFLVGLSAFWLKKIHGLRRVKRVMIAFLDGALIPVTFFPVWGQQVAYFLPFQYLRFIPINVYLGKYSVLEVAKFLGLQLVWILMLAGIVTLVWKKAVRRVEGVGT